MTSEPRQFGDNTLDDYLDGLLDEEAARRFEERVKADSELQAKIERQTVVNDGLRRMYMPPSEVEHRVVEAMRNAAAKTTEPIAHSEAVPFYRRRWAIAAILALGVVSAWRLAGVIERNRPNEYPTKPWTSVATYYRNTVEDGFKEEWVCETDKEFSDTFKKRLGRRLLLASETGIVAALGLSYANVMTPSTITLLARVKGKPVIVFVDRLRRDTHPELPPNSGLNIFRKELGRFILYEVSPLLEHHVMDLFYVPE